VGGKLNSHLMASCVKNIPTKNYQNLVTDFEVTVENVGDAFLGQSVVHFHITTLAMTGSQKQTFGNYCDITFTDLSLFSLSVH